LIFTTGTKPNNQRGSKMKATRTNMAGYSTQELIDYVERTDRKFKAAPKFIKRTSYAI
jgi:hypothetical protein